MLRPISAPEFVTAGTVGLSLVAGTILVVAVEDFKFVAINIVADKDIAKEFQECRFTVGCREFLVRLHMSAMPTSYHYA